MEELNKSTSIVFKRIAKIFIYLSLFAAFCLGAYFDWHLPLRYSVWTIGIVAVSVILWKITFRNSAKQPSDTSFNGFEMAVLVVMCGVAMFALASVTTGIYKAYELASSQELSRPKSLIAVGLLTLIIGIALFSVRMRWRCLYGISEALIGIIVASQRYYTDALLTATPTPSLALAILTAGVYLVVRGADNIHQGLTRSPLDPMGQKFLRWINSTTKQSQKEQGKQ